MFLSSPFFMQLKNLGILCLRLQQRSQWSTRHHLFFASASSVATTSEQITKANLLQPSSSHQTSLAITRDLAWLFHPALSVFLLLPLT